ncbi:hypothetical protein ACIRRA_23065 [Nocardia sp. NPDC101769]
MTTTHATRNGLRISPIAAAFVALPLLAACGSDHKTMNTCSE